MPGHINTFSKIKVFLFYLFIYLNVSLAFVPPSNAANWLPIEDVNSINLPNEFWVRVSNRTFHLFERQPVQKCPELIYQSMLEDSSRPLVLKHYHIKSVEYLGQNFFGNTAAWNNFHPSTSEFDSNMAISNIDINLPLSRFRIDTDMDVLESFEKLSKNISYEKLDAKFGFFTLIAKEHEHSPQLRTRWETALKRNLGGISLKCTAQLSTH
jgi:hypothetical protein